EMVVVLRSARTHTRRSSAHAVDDGETLGGGHMHLPRGDVPSMSPRPAVAHRHARHALSRRAFMSGAASAVGVAAGAGLLRPTTSGAVRKSTSAPKPTANVLSLNGLDFHITPFGPGIDPSSIGDFNGFVGVAQVQGTGTGTNADGSTEPLLFDTDMRFMRGVYIGQDKRVHHGTFRFI